MTKLAKPLTPNHKPLLRRMNAALKEALVAAEGAEKMEVDVGYLTKAEVEVVAGYFLKRGWQAAGYKWVEAYERHYGGNGAMKVVWVGEKGEAKKVKARYAYRNDEADVDGAPYGGR